MTTNTPTPNDKPAARRELPVLDQRHSDQEGFASTLVTALEELLQSLDRTGKGGRPRKGTVPPPSKNRLGDARYDRLGRAITRPTALKLLREVRNGNISGLTPDIAAYLCAMAGKRGTAAFDYLMRIGVPSLILQAEQWRAQFHQLINLTFPGESEVVVRTTRLKGTIEFELAEHTVTYGPSSGVRELQEAQRLMAGSNEFGWVTVEQPWPIITAPSRPMCRLVGVPFDKLDGAALTDTTLFRGLQNGLDNFGEAVLAVGMFLASCISRQPETSRVDYANQFQEFFDNIREYVSQNENLVRQQIAQARAESADNHISDKLPDCLRAALGERQWPTFHTGHWNATRIHVKRHALLEEGEVARFKKVHRPIPYESPLGYEIIWEIDRADAVAQRLMARILAQIAEESQTD
jgi:hypothetical protein